MPDKCYKGCLGGTFDFPLHDGHKKLLEFASRLSEHLLIGLRPDSYFENNPKGHSLAANYFVRKMAIEKYLKDIGHEKYEINELTGDIYNESLMDESCDVDIIFVSNETIQGAYIINSRRRKLGLKEFYIGVSPTVLAKDKKKISTSRMHKLEITRNGRLLKKQKIGGYIRVHKKLFGFYFRFLNL